MARSLSDPRRGPGLLAALLVLSVAGLAVAGPGPVPVATLVELSVDGQPVDSARVRGAFDEALSAVGFARVTAAAAGIESAAAAEKGAGHPAADLVIIARIDSRKLGAGIAGTSLVRYEAAAEARVLVTETGEMLGSLTATGPGLDVDAASAARIAGAHAAKALAAALTEKLDDLLAAPRGLELHVVGVPDAAELQRLTAALGALPGVEGGDVRSRAGRDPDLRAVIRLTVRGLSAAAVAGLIEDGRGLGLTVDRHTLRRVHARYDATRRIAIAVKVQTLGSETGRADDARMLGPLTRVLRTALAGRPAMRVAGEAPFTVRGALQPGPDRTVRLSLRLIDPQGAVVARASASGPPQGFSKVVRRAARGLGQKALAAVVADRDLRAIASVPAAVKTADAVRPPPALIAEVDVVQALVGLPVAVEVVLGGPGAALDDVHVTLTDAEGRPWGARRVARLGSGETTRLRFEGPTRSEPGAIDLVATVQDRAAGRWITERRRITAAVYPAVAAR